MNPTTTRIATYLPPWAGSGGGRIAGLDEDAVTMAVAAGRLACDGARRPTRVEVVTREPALLEGGSAAVLAAGLGLPADTVVVERLGGAAAALDAVLSSPVGTLVVGVDVSPGAGAGAVLVGDVEAVTLAGRALGSLPIRTRHLDGSIHQDDDARLVRERGTRALSAAGLDNAPTVLAGVSSREARPFVASPTELPTLGASSPFFALALAVDAGGGTVAAVEQASVTAATVSGVATIARCERPALELPPRRITEGPDIKIALTAYERAFDAKVRWEAGRCEQCGTLALPPRHRCLGCGAEGAWSLVPLPRSGEVYTVATVHVPVPGLATPYSLAVVQLDGVDVRTLTTVTDAPPGRVDIGDRGDMVLRRVAMRSGIPDYGYAFAPMASEETG